MLITQAHTSCFRRELSSQENQSSSKLMKMILSVAAAVLSFFTLPFDVAVGVSFLAFLWNLPKNCGSSRRVSVVRDLPLRVQPDYVSLQRAARVLAQPQPPRGLHIRLPSAHLLSPDAFSGGGLRGRGGSANHIRVGRNANVATAPPRRGPLGAPVRTRVGSRRA